MEPSTSFAALVFLPPNTRRFFFFFLSDRDNKPVQRSTVKSTRMSREPVLIGKRSRSGGTVSVLLTIRRGNSPCPGGDSMTRKARKEEFPRFPGKECFWLRLTRTIATRAAIPIGRSAGA